MNQNSREISIALATLLGSLALLLWSTTAFIAIHLTDLPTFELLFFLLFITLICSMLRLTWNKKWSFVSTSPKFWAIGSLCIPLNTLGYYSAFKFISPAQADLIYYLYPIGGLMLAGLFFGYRIPKAAFIGAFLGFCGVFILFYDDALSIFSNNNMIGTAFAAMAALSWSIYMIFSRRFANSPHEMIGLFFGVGSIIFFLFHLAAEPFVMPSIEEFIYIVLWAVIIQSYSYSLWEIGIKKGNFMMMNILSYITPLCSIFILIASGNHPFSLQVVLATLLVIISMTVCPKKTEPAMQEVDKA